MCLRLLCFHVWKEIYPSRIDSKPEVIITMIAITSRWFKTMHMNEAAPHKQRGMLGKIEIIASRRFKENVAERKRKWNIRVR